MWPSAGGEFSRQWLQESTDGDSSVSSSQRSSSDDDCSAHSNTRELPSCIRPGLFIGSVAAERDLNILQAMGITHVLQVPPSRVLDDGNSAPQVLLEGSLKQQQCARVAGRTSVAMSLRNQECVKFIERKAGTSGDHLSESFLTSCSK